MANALFDPAREGFLAGEIDWDSAVIKGALVRGYAFNAAHKFVTDVTTAGGVLHVVSAALAGKAIASGVADANDPTFPAVPANAGNHSLLLFQSSAVGGGADVAAGLQRLIAWIDTGTNFPIVPNGGDVTIQFDNGVNRIFKL